MQNSLDSHEAQVYSELYAQSFPRKILMGISGRNQSLHKTITLLAFLACFALVWEEYNENRGSFEVFL